MSPGRGVSAGKSGRELMTAWALQLGADWAQSAKWSQRPKCLHGPDGEECPDVRRCGRARQVERGVDQRVPGLGGMNQMYRELGVLDLPGGARVLATFRTPSGSPGCPAMNLRTSATLVQRFFRGRGATTPARSPAPADAAPDCGNGLGHSPSAHRTAAATVGALTLWAAGTAASWWGIPPSRGAAMCD